MLRVSTLVLLICIIIEIFVANVFLCSIYGFIELFRGHVTLQLNARAIEAGVQASPSSYGTLCCLWLFQALWTR